MNGWRFYKTADGGEVVKHELAELGREAKAGLVTVMKAYQRNEHLPRELGNLGHGIWYLRATIDASEYRLYFCRVAGGGAVSLAIRAMGKRTQAVLPTRWSGCVIGWPTGTGKGQSSDAAARTDRARVGACSEV